MVTRCTGEVLSRDQFRRGYRIPARQMPGLCRGRRPRPAGRQGVYFRRTGSFRCDFRVSVLTGAIKRICPPSKLSA